MTNPSVAYFFKRFYQNIIKWWFVVYNPIARRIWPTKEEEEAALEQERLEKKDEPEDEMVTEPEDSSISNMMSSATPIASTPVINDATYNSTTGAYSGLYGQKPVDSSTQNVLDEILNKHNSQNYIDSYIQDNATDAVPVPEDQEAIVAEANAIYERLLREAAEDEARKQAEINAALAAQDS